jgi:hypothetical protein
MRRGLSIIGGLALVTATTTAAVAAVTDVTGIVTHVHPASNIVKLNDGRTIYLEPGATFTVDGRQVTIDQIRPGMRVSVNGGREMHGQTQAATTAPNAPAHGRVDASGTVAQFDPQTNVITFKDGRMVKLGSQSSVWQQGQLASITPGSRVFVHGAEGIGYRTAWDATTMPRHRMGTVVTVDPASALVILSDGSVVQVSQRTRVQSEGRPLTLADLRPGDEVVIVGAQRVAAPDGDTGGMAMPGAVGRSRASARTIQQNELPSFYTATFDADEIHLMRRHQAP